MIKTVYIIFVLVAIPVEVYATFYSWSEWTSVGGCFIRKCNQKYGKRRIFRNCLSCEDDACKQNKRAERKDCPSGKYRQDVDCYHPTCQGDGLYTGQWTPWMTGDHCPPKSRECEGKKLKYTRDCAKGYYSKGKPFECVPMDGVGKTKDVDCPCAPNAAMRKKKKEEEKRKKADEWKRGTWGEWSNWSCKVDCSTVDPTKATRKRQCVNNQPGFTCRADSRGIYSEQTVPCLENGIKKCPSHTGTWGEWSQCTATCGESVAVKKCGEPAKKMTCAGKTKQVRPCPALKPCPRVDGRWSDWTQWSSCLATCGWGVHRGVRKCNDPAPSGPGLNCTGPSVRTQICEAEVACPTYDHVYKKEEGDDIELKCNKKTLKRMSEVFKDIKVLWMKNGRLLLKEGDRIDFNKKSLKLNELKNEDTGVYACQVRYADGKSKTVSLFSLAIETEKATMTATEGKSVSMPCNGIMLSVIYPKAREAWTHNGVIRFDHVNHDPKTVDVQRVHPVEVSDAGIWVCTLKDKESNKTWTTNWVRLKVVKRKSLAGLVGKVKGKITGIMPLWLAGCIAGGVVLILLAICVVCAKKAKSKETAMMKEVEEAETKRLMEMEKEAELKKTKKKNRGWGSGSDYSDY